MEWECFEDKNNPEEWRVEAIDYEDDGQVHLAIFTGPYAQGRAEVYANLMQTSAKEENRNDPR